MNIIELLSKDAVCIELNSDNKKDVLQELVDLLISSGSAKKANKKEMIKRLEERELLGSTGIGKGVAIPHAKCPNIKKMVAVFAISKKGVDFKSLDGDPTNIFFLLMAPGEMPGPHLKALARISRLLDDKFIRDRLKAAKSAQEVLKIIKEEDQKKAS